MHSNSRTYRLIQNLEKSAADPFDFDRMPSSTELLVHHIIKPTTAPAETPKPKRRRGRPRGIRRATVKVSGRRQKAIRAVRSMKAVRM